MPEEQGPRRRSFAHRDDPIDRREKNILLGLVIFIVTLLAYLPTFRAGFIWDDPDYVVNNATLRDLQGLKNIWFNPNTTPQYYPLVHTTFWVEYHLWKLWPVGYHVDNVLLHTLGAILLWRVLRLLEISGCFFAALIWAVHPVNVESVAWVTERKNVLCGVFFFASLLLYLKHFGFSDSSRKKHYWIALSLFICALLSKTVAASMPIVALILIWWKIGRVTRRKILQLLPLIVLGGAAGLYTAYLEREHVGATGREWNFTRPDRLLIAGRAVWFYIAKVLLPINLSFIYPKWDIHIHRALQFLAPAAVLVVLAISAFRRSVLVAFLIFGVVIFPALGFSNIYPMRYSFVADHFQYLACAAIIALLVSLLMRVRVVLPIIVVIFAVATFQRAQVYHDPLTLWTNTLERNPNSFMVHFNYGEALLDLSKEPGTSPQRKHELEQEASQQRFRAMELAPDIPETHWNVGVDYVMQGDLERAMQQFHEALKIDPDYAPAYNSIDLIYLDKNDLDQAYANFDKATRLQPGFSAAQVHAGIVLERKGDILPAIDRFAQAVAGSQDSAEAHFHLANCLLKIGNVTDAVYQYQQTLRFKPDHYEALTYLGEAMLFRNQPKQAADYFQAALKIQPDYERAQQDLKKAQERFSSH